MAVMSVNQMLVSVLAKARDKCLVMKALTTQGVGASWGSTRQGVISRELNSTGYLLSPLQVRHAASSVCVAAFD